LILDTCSQFCFINRCDDHSTLHNTLPLQLIEENSTALIYVMVSVLAAIVVDRGFEPRSGQIKDYNIGICCYPTVHAALRSKSKDWLVLNQDNVSEWSDMSTRGMLFR
jgi:branched-subunit amino acid transport protein